MSAAPAAIPQYRITTPEQVTFRFEVAGLATRAMAWLLDQVLAWAIRLGIVLGLAQAGEAGIALILLMLFLVEFGYYVVFELWWGGQSPGKRALGIRVVSASGATLTFPDVMIRNLLRPLDTLPAAMALGGVTAFLDRYNRRLGDIAADTLVIRDARPILPQALVAGRGRDNSFRADPAVRTRILARVTREERDLMLDLMHRRDELEPAHREALFQEAAAYFRTRYGLPEGLEHLSDEQTVLNLALVVTEDTPGRAGG